MVTALGYISYLFICLFSPLQLFLMLRKKNVNLGSWPLVALVIGLALLELSFLWVAVPTYVILGNATSLFFTFINLVLVTVNRPPRKKSVEGPSKTLEQYAERTLRDNIFDSAAFLRLMTEKRGIPAQPKRSFFDRLFGRYPRVPVPDAYKGSSTTRSRPCHAG